MTLVPAVGAKISMPMPLSATIVQQAGLQSGEGMVASHWHDRQPASHQHHHALMLQQQLLLLHGPCSMILHRMHQTCMRAPPLHPLAVTSQGRAAWPVKGKAAALLSAVVRQQGGDAYTAVVPQLIARASEGPGQAEMACMLLHYISEDLTVFETNNNEGKRSFLSSLTNSVNSVFPFLCEVGVVMDAAASWVCSPAAFRVHVCWLHGALNAHSSPACCSLPPACAPAWPLLV